MTPDETQIQILANWSMSHAKRVTRDDWKNPEYRVIATIRKLRTDELSRRKIMAKPCKKWAVVSALHHCLLVFLFLADQIFYRSYVNRQHFRLRSFASLCSAVQYFWGRRSFQIRYAAHFLHGLAMIFLRDSLSVRSFLIAAMTRYSGFFQLSLVTRFACDIGQLARIWIWVSSGVITICV